MEKPKTYKQLIQLIAETETTEEWQKTCGEINRSFEAEKITWNDHQTLWKISEKVLAGFNE